MRSKKSQTSLSITGYSNSYYRIQAEFNQANLPKKRASLVLFLSATSTGMRSCFKWVFSGTVPCCKVARYELEYKKEKPK